MYKLLVVDDEPRQVRALANIFRQLRPEYEIFTAGDGREALEFILGNQVDILFTDIRMPNMDGLELVEKLKGLGITVKTVILSGYGEFEYAQKAIRYGVKEYVVKPISKADLQDILDKIEKSISEEKDQDTQTEDLKKKLDDSLPVYLERQLNKWVYGSTVEKDLEEIKSIFPGKRCGTVLATAFSGVEEVSGGPAEEFLQWAKFSMREALYAVGHSISFFLEVEKYRMVTVLAAERPFSLQSRDSLRKLEQYIARIKEEFGLTATIGAGEKAEDIFADIAEVFNQAQEALEHRFFLGPGKVIFYPDIHSCSGVRPFNTNAVENEISEALRHRDKTLVSKATSKVFGNLQGQFKVRPYQLKEDLLYLLLNQVKSIAGLVEEERYHSLVSEIKKKTLQCEEYRDLWHFANEILFEMIDISENHAGDKNGVIINKCKKYIQENYMDDISLETAAQKYYFNPSYFSNLFKNNTGFGFSEYLLKIRIQSAKNLLKSSDWSVAEISARVGFRDPTYFNRMFKREVGISPLKYRQMIEK